MDKSFISHIRSDNTIQSNFDHQKNVAQIASSFAKKIGCGDIGKVMGLLHDKGKEQKAWQQYLMGAVGYNNSYAHLSNRPHHAYIGALIANKDYPKFAPLIAQPIAGHHRGLYDYCDYEEEMKREIPSDINPEEILLCNPPIFPPLKPEDLHHVIRMLFSCLVDADSLDTEAFMQPEQSRLRGNYATMEELLHRLQKHLDGLRSSSVDSTVNQVRRFVQEKCIEGSKGEIGFYSLTVPTGGGKTLASVLWALQHAIYNDLQRVIIAIPYTSIIVQTAGILKSIFGEENVLEHHSNFNPDDIKDEEKRNRLQLATENWDYPIIVTTNVQLFESLFSNRRSDCRKLHNIVKSVIILDEVQTLPTDFYKPIVNTIDTLKRAFDVSFLFTTASQPILKGRINGTNPFVGFDGLHNIQEIIPSDALLHDKLRRVKLIYTDGAGSYNEIAADLGKHNHVLCIVNTRRDAKELYDRLPNDGHRFHLSRMMCPAHIAKTIREIKETLKNSEGQPIHVVATQLIEAGVDIDFPVVYRQEAGLDSILQAAGRCNREGKCETGYTYVFSLSGEHSLPSGHISQGNEARLAIGLNHDWFSPETMTAYFKQLLARIDDFDKQQMAELLYKEECEFETAASRFHLIDENTFSVIVNWQESMNLYQQLLSNGPSYHLLRQLSAYSVNVRERDFNELKRIGAIEEPLEGIYAITHPGFYQPTTGLTLENNWLEETYII